MTTGDPFGYLLTDRERQARDNWLRWVMRSVIKPSDFYAGLFARRLAQSVVLAIERAGWGYSASGQRVRRPRVKRHRYSKAWFTRKRQGRLYG